MNSSPDSTSARARVSHGENLLACRGTLMAAMAPRTNESSPGLTRRSRFPRYALPMNRDHRDKPGDDGGGAATQCARSTSFAIHLRNHRQQQKRLVLTAGINRVGPGVVVGVIVQIRLAAGAVAR